MSTPETFKRPPEETERTEKIMAPETPEIPVELGEEEIEQYADTAAIYVEQQAATITAGSTEQINESAKSIGLDQSVIEATKMESGVADSLAALDNEGRHLVTEMKAEMKDAMADTPVTEQEPNQPASWKEVFSTPAGEIFQKAMSGRAPDGQQDATRSRITNEFTMREFVRNYPAEAVKFSKIYEKEFGKPHDLLARAFEQVDEIQKNPPEVPQEDPKFAELSYRLNKDPEFDQLRKDLDREHKMRVFGTLDFTTIPLGRFMDLCNTDENLTFSADREAEKAFRQKFPEKAGLYDQRETTRVYRDPDGQINIDRDPLYLKVFEADSRGLAKFPEDARRDFVRMYPEKAKGYAERYPSIRELVQAAEKGANERQQAQLKRQELESRKQAEAREAAEMVAFRERARRVKEDLPLETEAQPVIRKMEASKNWTPAEWREQQQEMKEEPYLAPDTKTFGEIEGAFAEIERQNHLERTFERSPDAPYQSVDTRLIVRAPSLKNWGDSYHESHRKETSERGENAVIEIARKISANVNGVLENPVLAPEDKQSSIDTALDKAGIFNDDSFPVYLKGHEGPRGPVFIVQDGSHRVAAAKLVGLDHVRGRVGGSPDIKTAKKVWYESLALMPEQARNALRAIYDKVHPPTALEKIADDEALEEAKSRLDEIYQERDLNRQTMEQRANAESERYRKVEAQFNDATEFAGQVKDTKRFNRLRQEAGLQFLKENAPELWEEHNQEIDEQGYLVRKDGADSYTSSTGYDVGDSYRQIMIRAVEAYRREFPTEQKQFLAKKASVTK